MNAMTVLDEVAALLAAPSSWTKGALARDEHGAQVPPADGRATSWCMWGAVRRVLGSRGHEFHEPVTYLLADECRRQVPMDDHSWDAYSPVGIIELGNDSTNYEKVLDIITAARKRCAEEGLAA